VPFQPFRIDGIPCAEVNGRPDIESKRMDEAVPKNGWRLSSVGISYSSKLPAKGRKRSIRIEVNL
jgi:hypothetical protein